MRLLQRFNSLLGLGDEAAPGDAARPAAPPSRAHYSLRLPHPLGGAPLCEASLAISTNHHSQGEALRLQAHVDSRLRRVPARAPALAAPSAPRTLMAAGRGAARGLLAAGLRRLPVPASGQRVRTWVDIQVSTAPLSRGADALVPARLRELIGSGLPKLADGAPRIGLWRDPAGRASLGLLQVDNRDLPGYDGRPFSLCASVASLGEPLADDAPEDGNGGAGGNRDERRN